MSRWGTWPWGVGAAHCVAIGAQADQLVFVLIVLRGSRRARAQRPLVAARRGTEPRGVGAARGVAVGAQADQLILVLVHCSKLWIN